MILRHIKNVTFVRSLTPFFLYEQKSVLHIHTIFFIDTFILRSHTLIHICYFNAIQPHLMASKLSKLDVNPNWISALLTFLSTVLKQFATKLHSRLPALIPPALHKALSYLLFFLHSILTQHQS